MKIKRDLSTYIHQFQALNLDVIPLDPTIDASQRKFGKNPLLNAWQTRSAADQIAEAIHLHGYNFNLGLRCGGQFGLVVFDCEDDPTTQRIQEHLYTIDSSFPYPIVQSASGVGRHFYARSLNIPTDLDKQYVKFKAHVGSGEIRFRAGAQVVAPPSYAYSTRSEAVGQYKFLDNSFELLAQLESIDWEVLVAPLLEKSPIVVSAPKPQPEKPIQKEQKPPTLSSAPSTRRMPFLLPYHPEHPEVVTLLFEAIRAIPRDNPFREAIPHPYGDNFREPYESRSEAEAAIIDILSLRGWTKDQIELELYRELAGGCDSHFIEHAKPAWYFDETYHNAIHDLCTRAEYRPQLVNAYHYVYSSHCADIPVLTRKVLDHIVRIAWKDDRLDPVIVYETIMKDTRGKPSGIFNAIRWLIEHGYLEAYEQDTNTGYYRATLSSDFLEEAFSFEPTEDLLFLRDQLNAQKTNKGHKVVVDNIGHTPGLVWALLQGQEEPYSISDIAQLLHLHRNTVSTALHLLHSFGLVHRLSRTAWVSSLLSPTEAFVDDPADVSASLEDTLETPSEVSQEPIGASLESVSQLSLLDVQEPVKRSSEDLQADLDVAAFVSEFEDAWSAFQYSRRGDVPDIASKCPIEAFICVVKRVYGVSLNRERLVARSGVKLDDLGLTLVCLHVDGQLHDPSPFEYLWWICRKLYPLVEEKGWPYLWENIATSPKMVAWYVDVCSRHSYGHTD